MDNTDNMDNILLANMPYMALSSFCDRVEQGHPDAIAIGWWTKNNRIKLAYGLQKPEGAAFHFVPNRPDILSKYVYYYLMTISMENKDLSSGEINGLMVRIPPVIVQQLIIKFSDHIEERRAASLAEIKQIEAEIRALFSCRKLGARGISVERAYFDQVYLYVRGHRHPTAGNERGLYPVYGDSTKHLDTFRYDGEGIVIGRDTGLVTFARGKYNVARNAVHIEARAGIITEYFYYCVQAKKRGHILVRAEDCWWSPETLHWAMSMSVPIVSTAQQEDTIVRCREYDALIKQEQIDYDAIEKGILDTCLMPQFIESAQQINELPC
jgi:hypothetical protein